MSHRNVQYGSPKSTICWMDNMNIRINKTLNTFGIHAYLIEGYCILAGKYLPTQSNIQNIAVIITEDQSPIFLASFTFVRIYPGNIDKVTKKQKNTLNHSTQITLIVWIIEVLHENVSSSFEIILFSNDGIRDARMKYTNVKNNIKAVR